MSATFPTFHTQTQRDGQNVNQQATIVLGDRKFTAGGGAVDNKHGRACGYPKRLSDGRLVLTLFSGEIIGIDGRETASWRINSWVSNRMYQMEFTIDGRRFTGRTYGEGMFWKGKKKS